MCIVKAGMIIVHSYVVNYTTPIFGWHYTRKDLKFQEISAFIVQITGLLQKEPKQNIN